MTDFRPVLHNRRRPGTRCITQKRSNLWEGRYSPTWIEAKSTPATSTTTLARNVVLIIEMKTELAELKRQKAKGTLSPQKLEKGKKKGRKKTKKRN